MDRFSRQAVGWQVFKSERAEQPAALQQNVCLRQSIGANQITLHSDNGSPMKG